MLKHIYILLGLLALALGGAGVVLPLLPTTPFLLLALFCFSRGSGRWDAWFRKTKLYRNHLEGFIQNRALTLSQKVTILLTADIMIAYPFIVLDNLPVRVLLILVLLTKYYYFIVKIKTLPRQHNTRRLNCGRDNQ